MEEKKTVVTRNVEGGQPSPVPGLKKVKLAKDHQHAGVAYKAGDEIEVNEADEKWLRDNQVI
jgi:hypothetical protein